MDMAKIKIYLHGFERVYECAAGESFSIRPDKADSKDAWLLHLIKAIPCSTPTLIDYGHGFGNTSTYVTLLTFSSSEFRCVDWTYYSEPIMESSVTKLSD